MRTMFQPKYNKLDEDELNYQENNLIFEMKTERMKKSYIYKMS